VRLSDEELGRRGKGLDRPRTPLPERLAWPSTPRWPPARTPARCCSPPAAQIGKSYRHVWSRIKEAEHSLGTVLVASRVGGQSSQRSELTEQAQRLVTDYDALRQRVFDVVQAEFTARFALSRPAK
jgi:molybdate transport repressor ModE-like protein